MKCWWYGAAMFFAMTVPYESPGGVSFGPDAAVERRAGQSDLGVDAAVHPEDVVGVVDVVADPEAPRDHELAREASVARRTTVGIGPVPERARITLVDRDGVRQREDASALPVSLA